jgi:hypothetical protein
MLKRALRLVLAALAGPMASTAHADCAPATAGSGGCPQ